MLFVLLQARKEPTVFLSNYFASVQGRQTVNPTASRITIKMLLLNEHNRTPRSGSMLNTRSNDFIRRYIKCVTSRKRKKSLRKSLIS